jgi:hypothetical protein
MPKSISLNRLFLESWHPLFWIVAICSLIYFRSLFFGFVYFDDDKLILNNFNQLKDLKNLLLAFRTDMDWKSPGVYYRPFVTLSFMSDVLWNGSRPFGFHLSNILFHATSSCLLYKMFLILGHGSRRSFLFSLLFSLHPVLNHAVAFIPGRYDTLLGLITLISFLSFVLYLKKQKRHWLIIHFISYFAALFTKETAVIIPVIFAVYIFMFDNWRPYAKRTVFILSLWAIGLILFAIARNQVVRNIPIKFNSFAENAAGILSYIGKILIPFNLSVMPIPQNTNFIFGIASIIAFSLVFIIWRVKRPKYFMFGLTWFILFLAPTGIRVMDFPYLLEQRLYLPLMGFLLAFMESRIFEIKFISPLRIGFPAVMLILFFAISSNHINVFCTDMSFWHNAVKTSPDCCFAHMVLAQRHFARGNWKESEKEMLHAKHLDNNDPNICNDLGLLYYHQQMYSQAEKEFLFALAIDSLRPDTYLNLAKVQIKMDQLQNAELSLTRSLSCDPSSPEANNLLSFLYYASNRNELSLLHYQRAVSLGYPYDPKIVEMIKNK